MFGVASGQGGAVNDGDAGNERIACIDGSSAGFALRCQLRGLIGSTFVEDGDPVGKVVADNLLEAFQQ